MTGERERWMLATWPGVGEYGPWIVVGDVDLIELGARALEYIEETPADTH